MTVWLFLLGLSSVISACLCESEHSYVDKVIDLRTKFRQFLPEELKDVEDDDSDERSKEFNLTEVVKKYKKAGLNGTNWSEQDSCDDPAMSESKREWVRRMNPKQKNEYSWECNSTDYDKYKKSLERRLWKEGNRSDIFEDDISDLWDMYMANKTPPPSFPLAFSPPFMFQKYREYSLAYHNITLPTTQHWLLGPLTGDDGVEYDMAMARYKKYNISKRDPEKIAAAERFLENDMKGKNLNKSKDMVRYFIDLRRRLGVTLNWTTPTIGISEELDNMKVPDTEEIFKELVDEQERSLEDVTPPDFEENLRNYNSKEYPSHSGERRTTVEESTTERRILTQRLKTTDMETPPPLNLFTYQFNPIKRVKTTTGDPFEEDAKGKTTLPSSKLTSAGTEKPSTTTVKPETEVTEKIHTSTSPPHSHSEVPKPHPTLQQHSSKYHHRSSTQSRLRQTLAYEGKYQNNTAVKFLHKHKNKFLIGGICCLVAAKVFGS